MLLRQLVFFLSHLLQLLRQLLRQAFQLLPVLDALLQLIRQLLALFLAQLFSFVELNFLTSQILKHTLLHGESLILFFVLSFACDILDLELFLGFVGLQFFGICFVHLLLEGAGFFA